MAVPAAGQPGKVRSGILPLRSLSKGLQTLKFGEKKSSQEEFLKEEMGWMESFLKELLQELFDASTPFAQTDDLEICQICAFRTMCSR